jgi:hypothetical protein
MIINWLMKLPYQWQKKPNDTKNFSGEMVEMALQKYVLVGRLNLPKSAPSETLSFYVNGSPFSNSKISCPLYLSST